MKIPITRKLITAHKNSYQLYKQALDAAKQEEQAAKTLGKRNHEEDEANEIKRQRKECTDKQSRAEKMIAEGTQRLGDAIKNSKITNALPAQALLEAGNKLLQECRSEMDLLRAIIRCGC